MTSKVRLAVVGSVGVPASYGGFETLVENLIKEETLAFTVYCSGNHYKKRINQYHGAELVYLPLPANGVASIFYDSLSMLHGIATGHRNFLVLGTSGAIIMPLIRLFYPKVQIVTNIDGLEWSRSKWKGVASWFLRISEALAVKYSHDVIADNEIIANYVLARYKRDCVTIAYGGDHAINIQTDKSKYQNLGIEAKYALAICRVEPENNVHVILEAFSKSSQRLIFIGNWNTTQYGTQLLAKYGKLMNMSLLEPSYDTQLLWAYRAHCDFYVHGHSAGGTNPSLVEIMHFGKPVIAFDCKYNRVSLEGSGLFFSDSEQLKKIIADFDGRDTMGSEIREIALRRYTWDIVRNQYAALFSR